MIRCWPSVAKLYEPHEICENRVTFVNVKLKYSIDEDFTVNYCLQEQFKSSTRDWIGIFPRNWLNLQQYLTFEYTLSSPPNAESPQHRTITFPRIFHREALLNIDYQLVYISKEIQIMATSSYFRFTPSRIDDELKFCATESKSGSIEDFDSIIDIGDDKNSLPSLNIDEAITLKMMKNKTENSINRRLRPMCRYCHRQICGLKIDALRGDFLASFSDTLLDRVRRLERDLSLAETNLKNARNSRDNAAKGLKAYEDFVTEMLNSVDDRGSVQFTDKKGNKVFLRRIRKDESSELLENSKKDDVLKKEIVVLKNIIEKQQKTIDDLIERRNFCIASKDPGVKVVVDREIQTISSSDTIVSMRRDFKFNETKETNDKKIVAAAETPKEKKASNIDEDRTSKESVEKKNVSWKGSTKAKILKMEKPLGILVQGKNVKFAIVRL